MQFQEHIWNTILGYLIMIIYSHGNKCYVKESPVLKYFTIKFSFALLE